MCITDNEKCNIGTVVGIIALAILQTSASAETLTVDECGVNPRSVSEEAQA